MSKKSAAQPVPRRASTPTVDGLANWLTRRSRLVRLLIAAGIALTLTGSLSLFLFSYLLSLPSGSLNVGPFNATNLLTPILVVLAILGLIFYWIGWRVLVGFDFGEEALTPGRPAALWVIFAAIVLVSTVCLVTFFTVIAIAPG